MSSNDIAIRVSNLSKCYQIYETPRDRLKQFLLPRMRRFSGKPPKQYFREFWALKDVTFEIKKGETVSIIGRNGSGKSTLLQMICGTLTPTCGVIQTSGRVAALLELGSGFNPEFTGRDNVYLNAAILGLSLEEAKARFDEIVAFADIGEFIDQPLKTYSSGMAIRLAFAAAIHTNPEILIVDEALSVGDFQFQSKCFAKIKEMQLSGVTVVLVTHDLSVVSQFSQKAILIIHGSAYLHNNVNRAINEYKKYMTVTVADKESLPQKPEVSVTSKKMSSFYKISKLFHRSGTAEITISDWHLRQVGDIQPLAVMEFNQVYEIEIALISNKEGINPNVSFFFTDVRGNEVAGCALNHEGYYLGPLKNGDKTVVCVKFKAAIKPGSYLLNLGCSEILASKLCTYERLYSLTEIVVTGNKDMIGTAYIYPEVQIKVLGDFNV